MLPRQPSFLLALRPQLEVMEAISFGPDCWN